MTRGKRWRDEKTKENGRKRRFLSIKAKESTCRPVGPSDRPCSLSSSACWVERLHDKIYSSSVVGCQWELDGQLGCLSQCCDRGRGASIVWRDRRRTFNYINFWLIHPHREGAYLFIIFDFKTKIRHTQFEGRTMTMALKIK